MESITRPYSPNQDFSEQYLEITAVYIEEALKEFKALEDLLRKTIENKAHIQNALTEIRRTQYLNRHRSQS